MSLLFLSTVFVIVVIYLLSSIKILGEHERGVIFRLGRVLPTAKGPGIVLVLAPIDRMVRASLPQTGDDRGMVGQLGIAQTALSPRGKVLVRRELWDAISSAPVSAGEAVLVRKAEGLQLQVDPAPAMDASHATASFS